MALSEEYEWPVEPSQYEYTRVSDAEFDRRHRLTREFMDEHGLDVLLVQGSNAIWDRGWTNTRWLANHAGCQLSQAEYVIVPRDPDEEITVSTIDMFAEMPARRARTNAVTDNIRGSGFRSIRAAIERIEELSANGDGDRIGIVEVDSNLSLPHGDWVELERAFPDSEIETVTDAFWEVRLIKSDEEIEMIEASAKIGDRVIERMVRELKPGMTEGELFGLVAEEMTEHGGELPTMILLETTAMANSDDAFQRERARNRTLSEGDVVVNEHAARYPDGSESQFGTTMSIGEPTEEYQEMIDLMLEVHEEVVENLRAGNTSEDVLAAADPIEEAGYVRASPLAHGELGGGVSAGPHIGLPRAYSDLEDSFTLREDMVLVPEVHVSTPDYTKGVFICDTYAVTAGAPRRLNEFEPGHFVV
jgi:Xaa-Pro aminopeptidase